MSNKVFLLLVLIVILFITDVIVSALDEKQDAQRLSKVTFELNSAVESIFNGALVSSEVMKERVFVIV
ncbi:hypothetical protein [Shewanella halifaxensis]|uniref:hypothetical protein n=1 Tax=Shewanella halifaxensis TaxID=271098 RepID=UPI000D5989B6|nr:hypothetical protein [Shewanella halifaxensis]